MNMWQKKILFMENLYVDGGTCNDSGSFAARHHYSACEGYEYDSFRFVLYVLKNTKEE